MTLFSILDNDNNVNLVNNISDLAKNVMVGEDRIEILFIPSDQLNDPDLLHKRLVARSSDELEFLINENLIDPSKGNSMFVYDHYDADPDEWTGKVDVHKI